MNTHLSVVFEKWSVANRRVRFCLHGDLGKLESFDNYAESVPALADCTN